MYYEVKELKVSKTAQWGKAIAIKPGNPDSSLHICDEHLPLDVLCPPQRCYENGLPPHSHTLSEN